MTDRIIPLTRSSGEPPYDLVVADPPDLFDGKTGIRHGGCDRLADLSPDLDAFFCPKCGLNERMSGGLMMELVFGTEGGRH